MYARTYRIRQYEEKLFHDKSLSEIAFLLYAGIHMISEFMIAAFSQMQIHRVFWNVQKLSDNCNSVFDLENSFIIQVINNFFVFIWRAYSRVIVYPLFYGI